MTFDNARTIISLRLRVFIACILLLIWVFIAYLGKDLKFPLFGLSMGTWTFIVLTAFVMFTIYPALLKYMYVYFSDDGPSIVFRFYFAGLIKGKRQSIEIPKQEFAGYSFGSYAGGLKLIYLKRKIDRKVVQYPPIYLGSLKSKELENIKNSLDKI